MSVVMTRSANTMDDCGHGIMPADNVPVLSGGVHIMARSANTMDLADVV